MDKKANITEQSNESDPTALSDGGAQANSQSSAATSEAPSTPSNVIVPQVGQVFYVKRLDGESMPAEVLETRINELKDKKTEYFVHFENQDKRLDEWIELDRFDLSKGELVKNSKSGLDSSADNLCQKKITRNQKRKSDISGSNNFINDLDPTKAILEKEHEELTKVKYIDKIQFGKYEIDTWYFSPYPEEYGRQSKLYICEFCLKYMKLENSYRYHMSQCTAVSPPGKEIYKKGSLSVFEVDGRENKLYCQNLCLLSKLFLDHKTLYFDVLPFVYYVLTEVDKAGCHLVGYFSKEKQSVDGNNLACILTLPPFQRHGYGKFLISLSYQLNMLEGVCGSPEKPLSDLGKLSYRSYWSWVILNILNESAALPPIKEIARITSFTVADIVDTLNTLNMVKYWKGQHIICVTKKAIEENLRAMEHKRPLIEVDPDYLTWEPARKQVKSGKK